MNKTIVVNRWPCQHLDGGQIVATIQRHTFSRLALCLPTVTHLQPALHLPEDDPKAELSCIGDLCATGKACANHKPWVLEYLFTAFKEAA